MWLLLLLVAVLAANAEVNLQRMFGGFAGGAFNPPVILRDQSTTTPQQQKALDWSTYSIDKDTRAAWTEFELAMRNAKLTFNNNQSRYDAFCAETAQKNFSQALKPLRKFRFPTKKLAANATYVDRLNHAVKVQWALSAHYHFPSVSIAQQSAFVANEKSVDRVAQRFYNLLTSKNPLSLVFGFMGTSVMSGQDNCYEYTLAPVLQRKLEHLFGLKVEVRNQGQNGDSPDQTVQLLCSESTLGVKDLDFLHVWFPMMPQSQYAFKELFLRNWFSNPQSKLAQVTMFDESEFNDLDQFELAGYLSRAKWNPDTLHRFAGLTPSSSWGAVGDGFCRYKTREGATAVMKQNWHFGPMGFEILSDGLLMLYNKAWILALERIVSGENVDFQVSTKLPPKRSLAVERECTNTCGWRQCISMNQAKSALYGFACEPTMKHKPIICVTGNHPQFQQPNMAELVETWHAKTKSASQASVAWERFQSKELSSIRIAAERVAGKYNERAECSAFLDDGWSFRAQQVTRETDWLEFTFAHTESWPKINLLMCNGVRDPEMFYNKQPGLLNWHINFRVYKNDKVEYEHQTKIEWDPIMPACTSIVRGGDKEHVNMPRLRQGTRFAVQFVHTGSQVSKPASIIVGNLLFWEA